MCYSCLEELQVDLDLHALDKTSVLSKAGCQCNEGWFIITDDGYCHLFDKDGNLDDIKKIKQLEEKHIRKDITKIVIPNSITSIGWNAFSSCRGLTSVAIPDSITSIRSSAFEACVGLTSVTIPDSVTNIGYSVFYYCIGLTSVTIGNGVTSIETWAFSLCSSLINLTFKGKTLEQVKKMDGYPWGIKDESIINVE